VPAAKTGARIIKAPHPWNVTPAEARAIQITLREKVERKDRLGAVRLVAGADVAFFEPERRSWETGSGRAFAAMVVYRFPGMAEVERVSVECSLGFPYVPGLLSFREIPALTEAFLRLRHRPNLIFCDGQGWAHPRRFGLASHLGVVLKVPTIGCAKSRLTGSYREPGSRRGSWSPLRDAAPAGSGAGEVIGAVLRTANDVRPIFVSPGHRVSLRTAIRLVLAVCDGRRIPRPTRDADSLAGAAKRAAAG